MAYIDYYHCDVCRAKAFYDANISDPAYVATYAPDTVDHDPIAIKALCAKCAKTHDIVVVPK